MAAQLTWRQTWRMRSVLAPISSSRTAGTASLGVKSSRRLVVVIKAKPKPLYPRKNPAAITARAAMIRRDASLGMVDAGCREKYIA